ncbi:MAG: cytochrome c nitrite reductase small subunit [Ignavibacterium album]|jgi:cytochrome c nitrite reductase small subunit|uniref:cytochrome c nitrite reductase small subunit n=1 Tax=Ignavibacterium album TaxID=591197 RepID=UPI0026F1A2EC|nr:cytochrome c nitrite reductase small subunit [Ignavibacterium album]MCX8106405.1 cytochrome c nitrite reductase small subunit [Ignavibacterium album]
MKLKKLLIALIPPPQWRFVVIILVGIGFGLLLLTLHLARATSYLSDDPAACVNCHVMAPYFATWEKGSHGRVATCNDCHIPHDNIINTYLFKAKDGMRHSYVFTFRLEPQVIRIKQAGKDAVQKNCIRCHQNLIHPISLRAISGQSIQREGDGYCWDCHRETPHGRVNSLTSAPYARVPQLSSPIPSWMEQTLGIKK